MRVDTAGANQIHRDLDPLLPMMSESDYTNLDATGRSVLTARLASLVSILEREKPTFVVLTRESEYEVAYRQAVQALRADAVLRAATTAPNGWNTDAGNTRDQMMASNLEWVMDREGDDGRVLLFAHNVHVKSSPMWPDPWPEYYQNRPPTYMGERLRLTYRDKMVVIGTAFGGGEGAYDGVYEPADPESFDGLLARIGQPLLALRLDSPTTSQAVDDEFGRYRKTRFNDRYGELDVRAAFDMLIYVEAVTPVRREPLPR